MSATSDRRPVVDPGLVAYPPECRAQYRASGWWTGRTLPEELVSAGSANAERIALITPEVTWTYGELFDQAARIARGLAVETDVVPGESVMFQLGNVAETVAGYVGCLLAGLRPVCTLPQHGSREIGLLAAHTGARLLLTQADFGRGQLASQARDLVAEGRIDTVISVRGEAVPGGITYEALLRAGEDAELHLLPYLEVDPDSVAVYQLSGGTTGLPKVAPRLHEEYAYNSRAWAAAMNYGPDSCLLYPLPSS